MWPDVRDGKTVRRKKEALIFEKRRKEKEDRKKICTRKYANDFRVWIDYAGDYRFSK